MALTDLNADNARARKLDGPLAVAAASRASFGFGRRMSTPAVVAAICAALAVASLLAFAALPSRRFVLLAAFVASGLVASVILAAERLGLTAFGAHEQEHDREPPPRAQERAQDEVRPPAPVPAAPSEDLRIHYRDLNASLAAFADDTLAQHPMRLASVLEIVTRSIGAQTQTFADRLASEQGKLTEALDLYGQSIVARLNQASVALAREFRDSSEDLYKRVADAGEAAVVAVARQGEATSTALGKSADEVERRLAERTRDILSRLEGLSAAATDAVGGQSEALARRAEESAAAMETRLRDVGLSIDRLVEGALARFETTIGRRNDALAAQLTSADQELDRQWTLRRDGLAAAFATAAGEASVEVAKAAAAAADTAQRAFAESARTSLAPWITLTEGATQRLDGAAQAAAAVASRSESAIVDRLAAFEREVGGRTEALAERLASQTIGMREALDGAETTLAQRGVSLVASIHAASQDMDSAVANRLTEVDLQMGAWRDAWDGSLQAHARALDQRVQTDVAALDGIAERHRAAIAGSLDNHSAALRDGVAAALADLQTQSAAKDQEMVARTAATVRGLVDGLLSDIGRQTETLASRGDTLRGQIVARQSELIEAIERGVARTEKRFGSALTTTSEALSALAARIDASLEQRGQSIARTLEQATHGLLQTMNEGARKTQAAIERSTGDATQALDASGHALVGAIAETIREGSETLTAGFEGRRDALAATVADAGRTLERATATLVDSIASAAMEADRLLGERRRNSTQAFETDSLAAARTIDAGRDRLVAALAGAAEAATEALRRRGLDTRQALDDETRQATERLEASRAALAGAAARAAEGFAAQFATQQSELSLTLANGAQRIQQEYAAPLTETLRRVEAEGAALSAATRTLSESLVVASAAQRESLQETFSREAEALAATVARNAEAFRRDFEAVLAGADDAFLARGVDVARELADRINALKTLLEGEGRTFLEAFAKRGDEMSQQVETVSLRAVGDFERKANALIGLLTRRGDDLLSAMAAASSESARRVAHLTGELDASTDKAAGSLREMERKAGLTLALLESRGAGLRSEARKAESLDTDPPGLARYANSTEGG